MTGRLGGLVTLFQRAVDGNDLFRIWCVLHQLDLVVQKAYKKLHDDDFIQELTACVSHLRRQQNLISAMGSTCPMLMLTRWAHLHRCLEWFIQHRIRLEMHFKDKKPRCTPSTTW